MIEKEYFKVYEGDSAEFKKVMEMFSHGTFEHRNRVREAWNVELSKITTKEGVFAKIKKLF